ncbi:MAG: hypothetical protein HOO91_12365 [Bacteroidales bacterium]|nr:hypothetical protein [Bacteroidales bacterium]
MNLLKFQKKDYPFLVLSFLIYSILCFVIFRRGLILAPDSDGYINPTIIRSPVYPLIIQFCKLLVGIYYDKLLLLLQIVIGLIGVGVFSKLLFKQFSLNKWLVLVISFMLFSPYIFSIQVGNMLLTESLAYPLFLITIKYILEGMSGSNHRKFILSFFFLTLLILTRSQFLFLYPLIAIIFFYLFIFTTTNKLKLLKLSIIFIGMVISCFLLEMTYHYVVSGKFIRTPFTGIQLATNAIYVSSSKDSTIFYDKAERQTFVKIVKEAENKQLTLSTFSSKENTSFIHHYGVAYNEICWRTIYPILQKQIMSKNISDMYMEIDKITISISKKLMLYNWKPFLTLYFKNMYNGMGGFIGFTWTLLSLLCLLALFFIGKRSIEIIILATLFISHLLNLSLVSLVEPIIIRYSFYTEILLLVVLTSILLSIFQQKKHFATT